MCNINILEKYLYYFILILGIVYNLVNFLFVISWSQSLIRRVSYNPISIKNIKLTFKKLVLKI